MSDRRAAPRSRVAWATVCFCAARTEATPGGVGPDDGSSFVAWRSDTARGSALIRFDPLVSSAGPYPYPYPSSCSHAPGRLLCDVHLWADVGSVERTELTELADVLVVGVPLPPESAHRRVRELLAGHPGCLAAAVPGGAMTWVVGVRDRRGAVSFVRPERGGSDVPIPPWAAVSVVHAWVVSGRSPRTLRSVSLMPRR
ncbi:hypothetical protein [Streptomyces tsukubensis]|uniref:Uncharacterized protein n=1 Tax=Streptomyces tsukubensis TaxID=83656 RepID=A0A1V4A4S2_9ACTN|nr:hypothetical protein [Streptomyces tsukubensis]OON74945.1 hypothetical protein B1H18_24340 [Streptomyces tsukubensis]QFR94739.1 hypothetical protein GBW32_18960 [Streptomyces tsukubensis]